MGSILASTIVTRAANILFDINGFKWSRPELLGWLNDGQRTIAQIAPAASSVTVAVQLVAGSRQSIPSDCWTLIDVYRNLGSDGQTPGRALRLVKKALMDNFVPGWHAAPPAPAPMDFLFDLNDQERFWVYPPSDGTGYVEANCAQVPPDLANEAAAIGLSDIFAPMLIDYVLYRAGNKQSEFSPGEAFAKDHWGAFAAALAAKTGAEVAVDPNQQQSIRQPPQAS